VALWPSKFLMRTVSMPLSVSPGRDACPSPGSFCLSSFAQYCAVENGGLIVPPRAVGEREEAALCSVPVGVLDQFAVGEPFAIERTQHRTSPRGAFNESKGAFAGTGRR
jgi:hypothetical protein